MNDISDKTEQLTNLIAAHASKEGPNPSGLKNVWTYKNSHSIGKSPMIDQPAIWIIARGKKKIFVGSQNYEFNVGDMGVLLLHMALDASLPTPVWTIIYYASYSLT
jgi:hypothetical protein